MIDLFKKTVLAAVGATVVTKDKVEEVLSEYVEKGKLNTQEAQAMAERIAASGRKEFEESSENLRKVLDDFMRKANFATQSDFEILTARVAQLEARMAQLENPAEEHSGQ